VPDKSKDFFIIKKINYHSRGKPLAEGRGQVLERYMASDRGAVWLPHHAASWRVALIHFDFWTEEMQFNGRVSTKKKTGDSKFIFIFFYLSDV